MLSAGPLNPGAHRRFSLQWPSGADYVPYMRLWRRVTACLLVLSFPVVTAVAAHAATAASGTAPVRGLDVSSYQHLGRAINWRLLARGGMRFVAIKASEGTYYTNPYYASDARAAAAAGLAVLPYVFANPGRAPGAATARFGVAVAHYARDTADARLPLVADLENDPYAPGDHAGDCYGLSVRRMVAWITAFTTETAKLTGQPPVIYTTAGWWQECTGNTALFRRDPLWLASYGTAAPSVPSPWPRWTFWQYSDNASVPGVGLTDLDFYQATAALPSLRPVANKSAKRPPGAAPLRHSTNAISNHQFSPRSHHKR
jgi:GH25 family lysozyme M1 (1,4-beta-N-acetylmuramidase)